MTSSTKPGEHSADGKSSSAEVLTEVLAAELTKLAEGYRRLPGTEHWDSPEPPVWHDLPTLGVFALGDQIAVVGNDLVAAYRALKDPRETFIWTPGNGRVPAEKAMAAVLESTTALRKAL